MSTTAKAQAKQTALPHPTQKPQHPAKTNKAKIAEKNYLQPKPAQGSHLIAAKKETGKQNSKPVTQDLATAQPARGRVADSLDQQMSQVDSQLFQSRAQEQAGPAPGASTVPSRNPREAEAAIDDSEFYRSMTMVDNTKDTLVEQNIKTVLERRLEEKPSEKTADRLYEKLPMLREGIYRKDYTPQDLALSRPRYGDANNPYDSFSAKPVDEPINSIHRRDFVAKGRTPGEPVHRDVTKSQQDLVKHLRAPAAGDSMYRVGWAHQADFPYWGVVPPPGSILPNNPKNQADGMPFMGKSTSSDYGNFLGIKDKPITIHRHLKSRSPLGPNIPLYSETEYNSYMKPHDPKAMMREPKYKGEKEAVGPFEGNYQSVYQDFVDHKIGDKMHFDSHALRESALKEKEALIVIASRRVMEDPALCSKVFDATYS